MNAPYKDVNACCGCSACAAVCPHGAVTMQPDGEGFLYPHINVALCVDCGRCAAVCAFHAAPKPETPQKAWAAYHKDVNVRKNSRSGGVFAALAVDTVKRGGAVYGVALDGDLTARTVRVTDAAQLASLGGSKYVQSDKGNAFSLVKQDLDAGLDVLFGGTACEAAGLLSYLGASGTDTARLLVCDLVCHGVPSPLIWQENLAEIARRYGKPEAADFRDKRFGWHSHIESYRCAGKTRCDNRYTTVFYANVALRPACYDCPFASRDRVCDITLADFWGADAFGLQGETANGLSLAFTNTQKGADALTALSGVLQTLEIDPTADFPQPNLRHPTPRPAERDRFWSLYRKKGYRAAVRRFYGPVDCAKLLYNKFKARKKL